MSDPKHTLGAAVVAGVPQYTSVSQLERFASCQRKWWFRYVAGIKEPPSRGQELGSAGHERLERYYSAGADVRSEFELAVAHLLPKPHPKRQPEVAITNRLTAGGLPIVGYIDLLDESGEHLLGDGSSVLEAYPEILDWKYTKDLKWAKSAEQLADTTQMIGYGAWRALADDKPAHVRLSHVTMRYEGKGAGRKSTVLVPAERLIQGWRERTDPLAEGIIRVAKASAAADVEPNWDACNAYGGCHYKSACPRSKGDFLASLFGDSQGGNNTMGLLETLLPAFAKPTPENTEPAKAALDAEIDKLKAEEAAAKATSITLTIKEPTTLSVTAADIVAQVTGAKAPSVNPPDSPAVSLAKSAVLVPPEALKTLPDEVRAAAEAHAAAVAAEGGPVEPKKKGRPKKTAEPAAAPTTITTTTTAATVTGATVTATYTADGLTIFIDAFPLVAPVDVKPLDEYVTEKVRKICESAGVPDIRLGPANGPLGFGKWKGVLATLVAEEPPAAGWYHLQFTKYNEVREVVAEALKPLATTFVRGV